MPVIPDTQWLMPVIPATEKAEVRMSMVRSQPGEDSSRDPIWKNPISKKDWLKVKALSQNK
jgi:hypothetical protein